MKKALTFVSVMVGGIMLASAQTQQANFGAIFNILNSLQVLVTRLVPFAIGLAVLAFFWFLIQFIWKGGEDGEKRTKALHGMGLSVLALFVMVSVWGLVALLGNILGVGQGGNIPIPGVPVPTN